MIAPPVEKRPRSHGRWTAIALVAAALVAAAAPAAAAAQAPPPPRRARPRPVPLRPRPGRGPAGQRAPTSPPYQATGEPPDELHRTSSRSTSDIMPRAVVAHRRPTSTASTRTRPSARCPAASASVDVAARPACRSSATRAYGMAHIYGDDARRRDVRRRLRDRRGAAVPDGRAAAHREGHARRADSGRAPPRATPQQLTDQDFSDEELTRAVRRARRALRRRRRSAARHDILDYIAGINARIDEVQDRTRRKMPAEYAALGAQPEAVDRLRHRGDGGAAGHAVHGLERRRGAQRADAAGVPQALRQALAQALQRPPRGRRPRGLHRRQAPLPLRPARARVQPGLQRRCPTSARSSRATRSSQGPAPPSRRPRATRCRPGSQRSTASRHRCPTTRRTRVLVSAELLDDGHGRWRRWARRSTTTRRRSSSSTSCTAAASTSQGVSFPGASPWPLIGHGIDFAWSGTSANGDNQDTFVERLCNADGSPPTKASTHYIYKGECIPFVMRDQTVTTPVSPVDPQPPQDDHLPHAALGARAGVRLRDRRRASRWR